jgi:hypothetical protein
MEGVNVRGGKVGANIRFVTVAGCHTWPALSALVYTPENDLADEFTPQVY